MAKFRKLVQTKPMHFQHQKGSQGSENWQSHQSRSQKGSPGPFFDVVSNRQIAAEERFSILDEAATSDVQVVAFERNQPL